MLVMSYAKPEDFEALSKWLYGSLTHVTTFSLLLGSLAALSAAVVLWMFRRELNVMELGHDEAECLGVDTKLTMTVTIGAVALATSVSVALAGAIGFVGLVVPHLVRRMVGGRMQLLLPCCAVVGGVFLATAQSLTNLFPGSVGVGVICAIVSSPVFLLLLASRRNGEGRDV